MSNKQHWEQVYNTKPATDVSWYTLHLELERTRAVLRN